MNVLLDALASSSTTAKPKKMDANAVRYPTCVSDVAKMLSLLSSKYGDPALSVPPTLHFSAMEAMTKYDMCLVMARSLRAAGEEAETDHLEAEYEVDPNAATSRPMHCKLDISVIKDLGIDVECVSFEEVSGARRVLEAVYSWKISCLAVVARVLDRGAWWIAVCSLLLIWCNSSSCLIRADRLSCPRV